MRFLVDTHLLLWLALVPSRVPAKAMRRLEVRENALFFSSIAIWEIAIKRALGREGFQVDVDALVSAMVKDGWQELPMVSENGIVAGALPSIHRDPFDRGMIGQAICENMTFLTGDLLLAQYGRPVEAI